MNHIYNEALAQARENKEELNNLLKQASGPGRQTIALLLQHSIFNEPIQEDEHEIKQKEFFISLIRSSSHLLSGQRFSVHDPEDS